MSASQPKLSICIPAYNRPYEIMQALESVAKQGYGDWDIVICEDKSPSGEEIRKGVDNFIKKHPSIPIRYFSNESNLGYDKTLRRLLDIASGEYCLFLSDDDLLTLGSLQRVINVLSRPHIGLVLRAWRSIEKRTGKEIEEFKYFPEDRLFQPGADSIAALYRRSVFISGLTVHREKARKFHTERFDGRLLYQLYLVGRVLMEMNGYYISDVIAIRRIGGDHYFGTSITERDRFIPGQLLPSHSVTFIKGLLEIARALDAEICPGVFDLIRKDLGRYSYSMLEIQGRVLNGKDFREYTHALARLGLGTEGMFWMYYYMLVWLGPSVSNALIRMTKRVLGHTPNLNHTRGITVK